MKGESKINLFGIELLKEDAELAKFDRSELCKKIEQIVHLVNEESSSTPLISELNVVITDPVSIKELNNQFRSKDEPTDVLSFAGENNLTSELYICPEYIVKRLQEEGLLEKISLKEEFFRMIVHGCLHLIGFDHENHFEWDSSSAYNGSEQIYLKQEEILKNILN
ncbi:MAG: hypothetical protein Fur003_3820 [Candidatus Dojkabacteria bacterium]